MSEPYTYPIAGSETLNLTTTGVTTLTVPENAYAATLFPSVALNYWLDGNTPTAGAPGTGTGFPAAAAERFRLTADEARAFQGIAQSESGVLIAIYRRV
jgi:hypothetical protein